MPNKIKATSRPAREAMATALETKFEWQLHRDIVRTLKDYGESFIDIDHGVDPGTYRLVARLIMQRLKRDKTRCLVAIRGGIVQGALADLPNIELEVHDYDVFQGEARDAHGRTKVQAERYWEKSRRSMHPVY